MDLEMKPAKAASRALKRLGKWKYPILMAAIGVGILLLPTGGGGETQRQEQPLPPVAGQTADHGTEERMEQILSAIDGAGSVRVMLTLKNDGLTEYQSDVQTVESGDTMEQKSVTVFRGGSQGEALIRRVTAAEYLGAVVISQGADRPEVCLKLVKAVSSLTGLPSNRITVLDMKKS